MADQRLGLLCEIIELPGQLNRAIEARRRAGNGNGQVLRQTDHRDVQPHLRQWLRGSDQPACSSARSTQTRNSSISES